MKDQSRMKHSLGGQALVHVEGGDDGGGAAGKQGSMACLVTV
jgi:hypothetical protein